MSQHGVISRQDRLAAIDRAACALVPGRAFIAYSPEWIRHEADRRVGDGPRPLDGLSVSVKDLMDVAGWPTTSGGRPSGMPLPAATRDAAFVAPWRAAGAWMVGKTHLNEHAYGLTGENPWWGDCTMPGDPGRLTGGSSSGAAATVLAGAADVGLGTDTGGSLRVPASLCGLASIRAPGWFRCHDGVRPLARTFDTLGWIGRDACELERVAERLLPGQDVRFARPRMVVVEGPLLDACDPDVREAWSGLKAALRAAGASFESQDVPWLADATALFAPLQAREAWSVHRGRLEAEPDSFGEAVRQRLEWGRSLGAGDERALRRGVAAFRRRMSQWLGSGSVLAIPACAVTRLDAGADHAAVRGRISSLSTPASVARRPVVTLPCPWAVPGKPLGIQWVGAAGSEWMLVRWAASLARTWARLGMAQSGHNETSRFATADVGLPQHVGSWDR